MKSIDKSIFIQYIRIIQERCSGVQIFSEDWLMGEFKKKILQRVLIELIAGIIKILIAVIIYKINH